MAVCNNCGAQNPDSSLYCQDCGSRLGDWKPTEGASRMATPPTGLSRPPLNGTGAGPAAPTVAGAPCPRCGTKNAPHMRFCNNCGQQLEVAPAAPPASAQPAPSTNGQGTVCWRCYGVGDPGAEFCKFCGARYADAPAGRGAPSSSAGSPPAPSASAPAASAAASAPVAPAPSSIGGSAASPVAPSVSARGPGAAVVSEPAPRSAPQTHPGESKAKAVLVSILKDGTDGRRYPIYDAQADIGRAEGQVVLGDDPYLSPRHARLIFRNGGAVLRDLESVNGVYVRLREPVDLTSGDMLLLGQQVLRFELLQETELPLGPATQHGVMVFGTPEVQRIARLVQYTTEGVGRDVHYLYRDETVIGREQGDLVFTDDPFMSRRHAAITVDRASRRFVLRDLGSSNGTAIRSRTEHTMRPGDQFRVGRHLFRFEMGSTG